MPSKISLIAIIIIASVAEAKVFRNAYISFEIPDRWACALENTEWVCRSEDNKEAKEAIIILTAKEVGESDSLSQYETRLDNPIPVVLKNGTTTKSQVMTKVKQTQINNLNWVEGFHLGSEVPNYLTRYLATIKEKIAVLVTFSAHKDYYTKYSADFFRAVGSLNVIATKNLYDSGDSKGGLLGGNGALPLPPENPFNTTGVEEETGSSGHNSKLKYLGFGVILLAAGALVYLRRKKS